MKIHNQLMIRVPQFPYDTKLEDVWEELLQSIEYASPEFYQKVSHVKPESLYNEPYKVVQTLLKYFNRAKYRCTPLGTFSAFGIARFNDEKTSQLYIKNIRTIHLFTDWKYIRQIEYEFSDVLNNNLKLFANSTYYIVADAIRYVRRKENTEYFELAEVERTEEIIQILKALSMPLPVHTLLNQFAEKIERQHLLHLLEAMILSNLILTELDPNTVGHDYFTRIGKFKYDTPKPYIISQLTIAKGGIPNKHFRHIPGLIQLLTTFLSPDTNGIHLKEFMSNYTKLFDRKHIRIMEALDPQIGVGYGNLYKDENTGSIIDLLTKFKEDKSFTPLESLGDFFKKGLSFKVGEVIDLNLIVSHTRNNDSENKLPNTFSVIGSIVDDKFLLERIGGHTANQLAGRFSLCGDQASQYAKDLVRIEEEANPDIVFFDIAYHAELDVDNINRRPELYKQQLNLISYPGIDEPLTLDDLFISVSGNAIVLRSQLLGKRVVPRMSSAYNYRRSQLPIFRFLYDLAFYGVWPDLSFDIKQILSGLKYYPKVVYKNIILSLPKLVIDSKDFKQPEVEKISAQVKQLLSEYQFGNLVKILKGEEHTVYDLNNLEEMKLFVSEIKRQQKITIEDICLPQDALIKDENGHPFMNQVIIPVIHHDELYPISSAVIHDTTSTERDFLPLQEWLYLDIFVHPTFADRILQDPITALLNRYKRHIKKWFFIRYNEHGEHLRLRFQANQESLSDMLALLNKKIKSYFIVGIIKDIKISTYHRELERYDFIGMEHVESHFHESSLLVLSLLNSETSDLEKYQHCLRLMIGVQDADLIGDKRFTDWTGFIRTGLEREHKMAPATFKALNKHLKDNLKDFSFNLSRAEKSFLASIISLIKRSPERRKAPLFTDLMHMHINRLFTEHQRTYELICYAMLQHIHLKRINGVKLV